MPHETPLNVPKTPSEGEHVYPQRSGEKTAELKALADGDYRSGSNPEDSVFDVASGEDVFRKEHLNGMGDANWRNATANAHADVIVRAATAERATKKSGMEDTLTGLSNRNAFDKQMPLLLERVVREGSYASILMLDFDFFKSVNDEYGHPAGDKALKQMAQIIKQMVRPEDGVYRYGGEEFVIYLPDTNQNIAKEVAERIRNAVESASIDVGGGVILRKTVSVGAVGMENETMQKEFSTFLAKRWKKGEAMSKGDASQVGALITRLIECADTALYAAKAGGRNQVVVYHPNPPVEN